MPPEGDEGEISEGYAEGDGASAESEAPPPDEGTSGATGEQGAGQDVASPGAGSAGDGPPAWSQPPAAYDPNAPEWAQPPGQWYEPPAAPAWQQPIAPQGVVWQLIDPQTGGPSPFLHQTVNALQVELATAQRYAATEQERAANNAVYQQKLEKLGSIFERTQLAYEKAQFQQLRQQVMRDEITKLRRQAIEHLAKELRLTPEEVAFTADGRPVWDAEMMAELAKSRAAAKYGQRVQQRRATGADRGYAPAGGDDEPDVANMSEKEWQRYQQQVRRNPRILYGPGYRAG